MSRQADTVRSLYTASPTEAAAVLRGMSTSDIRFSTPDRLPHGGTAEGVDAVVGRFQDLRGLAEISGLECIDDLPMVVCFFDVKWNAAAFAAQGRPAPADTKASAWWFFRDGKVEEVLTFFYDIGLVDSGASGRNPCWPKTRILVPGKTIFGTNRRLNPAQALIEKLYADATAGVVSDITSFYHPHLTLHESPGLLYGAGAHSGMEDVSNVIAQVVIWCNMADVRLVAVASREDHVSVLVRSPVRDSDAIVLIQEDWHLSDGKVEWYRAYYWDTDRVNDAYRRLSSHAATMPLPFPA